MTPCPEAHADPAAAFEAQVRQHRRPIILGATQHCDGSARNVTLLNRLLNLLTLIVFHSAHTTLCSIVHVLRHGQRALVETPQSKLTDICPPQLTAHKVMSTQEPVSHVAAVPARVRVRAGGPGDYGGRHTGARYGARRRLATSRAHRHRSRCGCIPMAVKLISDAASSAGAISLHGEQGNDVAIKALSGLRSSQLHVLRAPHHCAPFCGPPGPHSPGCPACSPYISPEPATRHSTAIMRNAGEIPCRSTDIIRMT